MNFKELKSRVRDLGFTDDSDITENISLLVGSLNSALKTINSTVKGIEDKYEYTQDGTETGLKKLDLLEATSNTFDSLKEVYLEVDDTLGKFTDYQLQLDKIVVFDKSVEGTFTFFYKKRVPEITSLLDDSADLPIAYQVEAMLPLLTAYYMWLDDDADIAGRWYNEYDELKDTYQSTQSEAIPKAKVRVGLWPR